MLEILARWLFGDTARQLEGLRFLFNVPFGQGVSFALLAAAGLCVALFFRPRLAKIRRPFRVFLVAMRVLAVMLILFLLLDPCISGKRVRRTDRAVVLLFDDTKSMQVAGPNGRTRAQELLNMYAAAGTTFEKQLRDKCRLIFCRFGESLERIRAPQDLRFEQDESDLVGAVERAMTDFEGMDVAAVALFSDGAQQAPDRPVSLDALERRGVPVFSVGVGEDAQWRDLEIGPLAVKRTDIGENPVIVRAPVFASGLAGQDVLVEALLDGKVVATHRLRLEGEPSRMEARLEFVPPKKGWLEFEARARLASGAERERIARNNARRFLVDNREKAYRILYLCGRPNWENKFVRRAMEDDKQLKLTSLVRISGPEKEFKYRGRRSSLANPIFEGTDAGHDAPRYDEAVFLRLGVEKSELSKGYPERAEELFPFQLVIWGEMEAKFFSQKQLELTREYVRKRGGGLLLLGGTQSFTEGGFEGTIIENLMPARLNAVGTGGRAAGLDPDRPFRAQPTLDGVLSGAWSLDPNPDENNRLWDEMPPLYRINRFALTRPGASVHAGAAGKDAASEPDKEGGTASAQNALPLFAIQRYGEGRCAVLATDSTWQWRLGLDEQDRSHERLWRQIVQSLVRQAPEPIRARGVQDTCTAGRPADLAFTVRDSVFAEREGLTVTVKAAAPSGREAALPVEESIQEAGLYSCKYAPQEPGAHRLTLAALDERGQPVGALEQAVLVEPDRREFHQAQYNPALLQDIARRTGGAFLPLSRMASLPDHIRWQPSQQAEEARLHLWRLPPFYFALAALLIIEWYFRRRKGLA
jgi:hypothetical protein